MKNRYSKASGDYAKDVSMDLREVAGFLLGIPLGMVTITYDLTHIPTLSRISRRSEELSDKIYKCATPLEEKQKLRRMELLRHMENEEIDKTLTERLRDRFPDYVRYGCFAGYGLTALVGFMDLVVGLSFSISYREINPLMAPFIAIGITNLISLGYENVRSRLPEDPYLAEDKTLLDKVCNLCDKIA